MASIEKRGNMWSVRYVIKDSFGNIVGQKRKSGFATKAEAMAAAQELEQASARGVDVHGDQLTCGELMERWFLSKPGTIAPTTLSKYNAYIERLKTQPVYSARVCNLNRDSLRSVIDGFTAAGISIRSAMSYTEPLRFSLRWAAAEGLILSDPLASSRLPKIPKRPQVILSDQDIADLVRVCRERLPDFLTPLYLALYGGLCKEEAAGLTWADVIPSGVRITRAITYTSGGRQVEKEPKTEHRARTVTLPRFVLDHLAALDHSTPYVCMSPRGKPYHLSTYPHNVAKLARAVNAERIVAGIAPMPVPSYHDLRHTHAAMCIALEIQPKVISDRLGHASIRTTMDLYGYLMPGLQEQAADALNDAWAKVGK